MMTNVNGYGKFEQIIDLYRISDVERFGEKFNNTERDKEILRLRFIDGLTYREIAEINGLTFERIRQIVAKSLRVIKNNVKFKEMI